MKEMPRIGDIVKIKTNIDSTFANGTGVVLKIRTRKDGYWIAAELLLEGQQRWFNKGEIDRVVGRPKGISRIDQTSTRTHGWYVRVYSRNKTRSRLFSDGKYKGIGPAFEAAMAFRDEAERQLLSAEASAEEQSSQSAGA
jgi:hypothetical protein